MNHGTSTTAAGAPSYPAKYFDLSPTYFHWCKLTIADVHNLRQPAVFTGQDVHFYLNHPIRYVYVVGPITAIEDLSPKTAMISLDDGSGACVDVKIPRTSPTTTNIADVSILSSLGTFDILVRDTTLDIGTVAKVKATICYFRDTRQLELKRISVVKDTSEEAAAWEAAAVYKSDVLSTPWVLTDEQREEFDDKAREEVKAARVNEQRAVIKLRLQARRREEKRRKKAEHERRVEFRRQAEERLMNQGAIL